MHENWEQVFNYSFTLFHTIFDGHISAWC